MVIFSHFSYILANWKLDRIRLLSVWLAPTSQHHIEYLRSFEDLDASSAPLSSSLSMCGNDPPKQNNGIALGSLMVLVVDDALPSFFESLSHLFSDRRRSAYRPCNVLLFLVIISRRFRPHFGDPFGLAVTGFVVCNDDVVFVFRILDPPAASSPSSWAADGNDNSSNGMRFMVCSTLTKSVCNNWGNSSVSISNEMDVNGSLLGSKQWYAIWLVSNLRQTAHKFTPPPLLMLASALCMATGRMHKYRSDALTKHSSSAPKCSTTAPWMDRGQPSGHTVFCKMNENRERGREEKNQKIISQKLTRIFSE